MLARLLSVSEEVVFEAPAQVGLGDMGVQADQDVVSVIRPR